MTLKSTDVHGAKLGSPPSEHGVEQFRDLGLVPSSDSDKRFVPVKRDVPIVGSSRREDWKSPRDLR